MGAHIVLNVAEALIPGLLAFAVELVANAEAAIVPGEGEPPAALVGVGPALVLDAPLGRKWSTWIAETLSRASENEHLSWN